MVRACRISLSSHAAGSEQSEHPLLAAVVPPHSLFFGGHAWQGAGTSGAPAPSPPSPHPLPASLTVSPELSPRRGLHSFGWRQALGASQISAPPTSPPPLLCFFPVRAGMGRLSLPQFHEGEGGSSRLSDEESINRSLYLFHGLQSMRMVAAFCAHTPLLRRGAGAEFLLDFRGCPLGAWP